MEQFIYVLRPKRAAMLSDGPTAEEQRIVGEHFVHLDQLTRQGVVKLAGRTLTTGPETMGIVVYEATDFAAAQELMQADPAVAHGVMTAEVHPFRIALMGAGA